METKAQKGGEQMDTMPASVARQIVSNIEATINEAKREIEQLEKAQKVLRDPRVTLNIPRGKAPASD